MVSSGNPETGPPRDEEDVAPAEEAPAIPGRYRRQRIAVWRDEILDATELERDGVRVYYGYTYKARAGEAWIPLLRWDNANGYPHVDRYDANGVVVESVPTGEVRLAEVLTAVLRNRRELLHRPAEEL